MIDDARTAHANTAFYRFKNTEGSRETHTRDEHTVIQGTQTTNPTTKPTYRHTISQVTTEGSGTATRLDPTPSTNTHVRRTWTGNRALSRCARLRLPLISICQTVYGAEHTPDPQSRTTVHRAGFRERQRVAFSVGGAPLQSSSFMRARSDCIETISNLAIYP